MLRLLVCFSVVVMAMSTLQDQIEAQAFFPIERTDTGTNRQSVTDVLWTTAFTQEDMTIELDNGENISSGVVDANYATDPQSSVAATSTANATSSVIPVAETLPSQSAWALAVESTIALGATWIANTGSVTSTAALRNEQSATALGEFEILANSSYPTVTSGTLEMEFVILNSSDYPDVQISLRCGDSSVAAIQMGGSYMVFGDLEGYGSFLEMGEGEYPGGVYTAYRTTGVGDTFSTTATAWGAAQVNIGSNDNASGGASISATVSAYASSP